MAPLPGGTRPAGGQAAGGSDRGSARSRPAATRRREARLPPAGLGPESATPDRPQAQVQVASGQARYRKLQGPPSTTPLRGPRRRFRSHEGHPRRQLPGRATDDGRRRVAGASPSPSPKTPRPERDPVGLCGRQLSPAGQVHQASGRGCIGRGMPPDRDRAWRVQVSPAFRGRDSPGLHRLRPGPSLGRLTGAAPRPWWRRRVAP